jgi:tetratricopeptide (TPR) repeat protein
VFSAAAGAARAESESEARERNRVLGEYYRAAMESYYRGEYTQAIARWNEILKLDPQQAQAEKLIEAARQKMSVKVTPLSSEVKKLLSAGEYAKALAKGKEFLALDPANSEWVTLVGKLEKVAPVIAAETGSGKVPVLVRRAVGAYTAKKENARLALNAGRYAAQLDKGAKAAALRELIESEYPALAQMERVVPGVHLVEQKLQASLSNLYDGKYDRALLECNDILELEPNNVLALKRAGSAYYASGNKQRAKESWTQAAKIAPDDPELKKFLKAK